MSVISTDLCLRRMAGGVEGVEKGTLEWGEVYQLEVDVNVVGTRS